MSAEYICGRVHKLLEDMASSNQKYLDMLVQKKERLEKGGSWAEKTQTAEDVARLLDWKLKEQTEILEILNLICSELGVCSDQQLIEERDRRLMEFIKSKPKLFEKLQNMQNPEQEL